MAIPSPSRPARARAFTLIELLVSMSVLTLLLVLVAQMVNSALAVTGNSTKHMNADGQARQAFDRMAADLAQIVKRQDVDYFFQKNGTAGGSAGADDQMAFYSETTGYYPPNATANQKSNGALVGYCIRKNSTAASSDPTYNKRQLVRLSKALFWNGVDATHPAMTYLPQTLPPTWPLAFPNSSVSNGSASTTGDMSDPAAATDPDFQVIGEQIFRMEICYLVRYAATASHAAQTLLSDLPYDPASTATTTAAGVTTPAKLPAAYNGLRDVAAVVVSLAVLDDTSRIIVQPADLDAAAARLEDVGTATATAANATVPGTPAPLANTPAKLWQAHLAKDELSRASGGPLPARVAAQVRVYERYFCLGNAQ